jgi:hypothetical protein
MLRTAYDAFVKGDVETVMSLLTDDIVKRGQRTGKP